MISVSVIETSPEVSTWTPLPAMVASVIEPVEPGRRTTRPQLVAGPLGLVMQVTGLPAVPRVSEPSTSSEALSPPSQPSNHTVAFWTVRLPPAAISRSSMRWTRKVVPSSEAAPWMPVPPCHRATASPPV